MTPWRFSAMHWYIAESSKVKLLNFISLWSTCGKYQGSEVKYSLRYQLTKKKKKKRTKSLMIFFNVRWVGGRESSISCSVLSNFSNFLQFFFCLFVSRPFHDSCLYAGLHSRRQHLLPNSRHFPQTWHISTEPAPCHYGAAAVTLRYTLALRDLRAFSGGGLWVFLALA